MAMPLPGAVRAVLQRLQHSGYAAYVVGGAVRDWLLGREPGDFDVTTSAPLAQVCRLFPQAVPTGAAFGTATVPTEAGGIQVTTFRRESGYSDRRRPDRVEPTGDLREDLLRRDFTVNTFCCDEQGRVLDLLDASADLRARQLRAVGEPARRFEEDALRILRAYRFSAQLGFSIEEQTTQAALARLSLLPTLSRERIAQELDGIVLAPTPQQAQPLLQAGGLAFLGMGPTVTLAGLARLQRLPAVRYGWFLHGNRLPAAEFMSALKFSNARRIQVTRMLQLWEGPLPQGDVALKRSLHSVGEELLCQFLQAVQDSGVADTAAQRLAVERIQRAGEPYQTSQLCLNGAQIAQIGGLRGPDIGQMQRELLEAVINCPQQNTPERLRALIIARTK